MRLVILGIILSFIGHLVFPGMAAAATCAEWVAKATAVKGRVEIRRAGQTQWTPVRQHDAFCPGDIIRVLERSNLAIVAQNGTNHRLDENTTITLAASPQKQTFLLNLAQGAAYFFSRLPRSLKVMTPFVNAGVEGTEFFVRVERDQTFLSVFEGQVAATSPEGSLSLTSGQSAIVKAGQTPERRVVVRPRDAVQWALYYPPILELRPLDSPVRTVAQAVVRQSLQSYLDGDLPSALDSMMSAPEDIVEPRFFTYRAALLLTVGRVDAARMDIETALKLDPGNSRAFALRSIIAVTLDKKDAALELAKKAVELEPASSVARVALSYAQQARFDLQGALASLKEAVTLPPENALTWARLAELWLSVGDLNKALKAAQRAVALNPRVARTQTVLGFAFLTQIKIGDATHAFEQAIQLDQSAPLPRLGLGLAQIRRGKLKEGRGEIEIAASLDPNNSLIRSYLGKAYFEEKRDKLARDQFATAKKLDPQDPTPWFYDAIRKQTVNRPVEALHDLQKSIELNDNRAIYRSQLLLDEDLAARSASLGRIYNDLGFQQLALVEGWKSLNVDPSNYSAHRFLADVYSALPRHEIARVSELLQSQLLQPINITPLQPQLAESNLLILEGAGPADSAFDEFNSLFNRNRFALQASGIVGENGTLGDELVHAGLWGKFSYSLGQFHFESDGFQKNNDLKQDIYNMLAQVSVSYKTSIQAEFRYRELERGSLLNFDRNISETFRREDHVKSIRFGVRHAFTPNSDVIASIIYQDTDIDPNLFPGFSQDGYLVEVQHLFRLQLLQIISGGGHVSLDEKVGSRETDIHSTNLYAYVHINYPKNLTWTIGGSADFFEGLLLDTIDGEQFNAKFGLTWNPLPTTTLRAAVFRTFRKPLISQQTIVPTQVAGFNQFFDDPAASHAWRYGIGIDQKFTTQLYAGAEFSRRDLTVRSIPPRGQTENLEDDEKEQLLRVYMYWTPQSLLALSAEYLYERFEEDIPSPAIVKTQRLPLGISFFHPSGFNVRMKTTYVDQKRKFEVSPISNVPREDKFWIVDAAIGYRLPKRWGLITVEGKNLFDQRFQFEEEDFGNPVFSPERFILARFTLAY